MAKTTRHIIVGISGASGVIYARRLIDVLDKVDCQVHVVVSEIGLQLLADELGITKLTTESMLDRASENIVFHDNDNMFNSLASGSFEVDGMAICPCSTNTLSAIACGLANTLLLRSAYVTLKQRRKLILVHREMPLTEIDIENMAKITRAGGIICPASPSFYMKPKTVSDLVDSVVGRVLDLLSIQHDLAVRWGQ